MAGDSLFRLDTFRNWQAHKYTDNGDSEDEQGPEPMPIRVDVDVRQLAEDFFSTNALMTFLRINSFYYFLVSVVHYILRHYT